MAGADVDCASDGAVDRTHLFLPVIAASGAPSAASRLFIHILIALGLWLGLERTGLAPPSGAMCGWP